MRAKGQTAANKDGRSSGLALDAGSDSLPRPSVDRWTGDFTPEGWITREGKFLPCDREMGHPIVAMLALGGEDPEKRAERMGWLRISDYGDRTCKPLNQSQRNTLFDYCQTLGLDYAETEAAIKLL